MSDMQRNVGPDYDEDRLPWLESVDDYEDEEGISIGRLIGAVVVGLVALGLVIGGIFWLRNRDESGNGTLIAAPPGPIKEKPGEPGGMEVDGAGDVAYDASVGKDVNSTIDLTAMPEAPVTETVSVKPAALPPSTAKAAPAPATSAPAPKTEVAVATLPKASTPAKPAVMAKPVAPAPKSAPEKTATAPKSLLPAAEPSTPAKSSSGSGMIQLGAFSSDAMANKAWASLSGRFGFLSGLDHSVSPVSVGDKTLYRLRANAGAQASSTCAKLKVAGEACSLVN